MLRSIAAVVTPIVVWGGLWVTTGLIMSAAFPDRMAADGTTVDAVALVILIVVSSALSVFAGWLCATLARGAVMKHVVALAVLQLAIGIGVQSGVWDLMPVWYHVTFLGLVVPMHLFGGRMKLMRSGPG